MLRRILTAALLSASLFAGSLRQHSTNSRVTFKTRQYNGVGYDNGYSTGAVFLAPVWRHEFLPFIDFRAHIFNNGQWAFNTGVGVRAEATDEWILGGNLFYDYRGGKKFSPQQIGGGLEALGEHFDIRLNGYGPIADTDYYARTHVELAGHGAGYKEVAQAALPVIGGEVGMPFSERCSNAFWYGALGPYYLFQREVHEFTLGGSWGGQARLAATFMRAFYLECNVTYDKIFKTTVQGVLGVSLPLGPNNLSGRDENNVLCSALAQPVIRNEIIPIEDPERYVPVLNPMTQAPAHFFFVNPAKGGGMGTWEEPFVSLQEAEKASGADDIIIVFPGTYDALKTKEKQLWTGARVPVVLGEMHVGPWNVAPPTINNVTLSSSSCIQGMVMDHVTANGGMIAFSKINAPIVLQASGAMLHLHDSVYTNPAIEILGNGQCALDLTGHQDTHFNCNIRQNAECLIKSQRNPSGSFTVHTYDQARVELDLHESDWPDGVTMD